MISYRKKLQFCSQRINDDTDSRFVLKFHGNRPPEMVKRCVVLVTRKLAKFGFLAAILRSFGRGYKFAWERATEADVSL